MKYLLSAMAILMMIAASCQPADGTQSPHHAEVNGVYYWKTVLTLDDDALDFMNRHGVRRVYLRLFDVTADHYADLPEEKAVPNATVRVGRHEYRLLQDSLSQSEFVPVVYITLDALRAMAGQEALLATNIVTRARNMCQYNGLPNVSELQLDCDWTGTTEAAFFTLCDEVKRCIAEQELPWRLSSTIRLHQLARPVPPVDNGVLMVYNTGNFSDPDAANSIIDPDDVRPYLKHLPSYPLHLDVAYPTYAWQLLFSNRQFIGLTNGLELTDTTKFRRRSHNVFIAKSAMPHRNRIIRAGDMVRAETSAAADILTVKRAIDAALRGKPHSNIIYHLDPDNLSKYSYDEINGIFSTAD